MALPLSPAARRRVLAGLVLVACVGSMSSPRPWQAELRGAAHSAAQPPLAFLASVHDALRGALDRVTALWDTAAEVERLREENRALREALARQADDAARTQAALRGFSAFEPLRSASLERPLRLVHANVIAADTSSWRQSLIIDRGSADGLRLGTPAVWGSSIVGSVTALRHSAATVRLLTDAQFGLTVRLARTGDVGFLSGASAAAGHLELRYVHLHPVEKGDTVVTSGLDPVVPPGLVAGEVISASQTRRPLFYDVKVRPLLDPDRLTELLLVLYEAEEPEELLREEALRQTGAPK